MHVADAQASRATGRAVAHFFLETFLGAELGLDPRVATKRFADAVEQYINDDIDNPAEQVRVATSLVSYLESNAQSLSARQFSRRFIPTGRQAAFGRYVANAGVPQGSFRKDLALTKEKLNRLVVRRESGIRVIGPPATFKDHVRFEDRDDGMTDAIVTDRFNAVQA